MQRILRYYKTAVSHIAKNNKIKYAVIQKRKFYAPRPPEDNNYMYYIFMIVFGVLYSNRRRGNPPAIY
jgi:hypothetical protein